MKKCFKIFLVLFLVGLLTYANGLNNKFLWDDNLILSHPEMSQTHLVFSQWNPHEIKYFAGYYRPMAHMVYAFCYGSFKTSYWKYHLLNLFLLVLLSWLIFALVQLLVKDELLAFLTATLFLLHPINGILVNNIVANALTIDIVLMMGAIILVFRSLQDKNLWLYLTALWISFLSLLFYDMGILLPLYLGAAILIFRADAFKFKVKILTPFLVLSAAYLCFKHFFLNGSVLTINVSVYHMTPTQYMATIFRLIWWYVEKIFTLKGIVMQWSTPIVRDHLFGYCLSFSVIVLLSLYMFFKFSQKPILRLSILWILIGFAPICLMAFINYDVDPIVEPHWFLFSSMGIFIFIAYVITFLVRNIKVLGLCILFFLIFTLGTSSRAYNQLWGDQKAYALFWSKELPQLKFIDHILADTYLNEGDFKTAVKYYKLANHGHSISASASDNIGYLELQQGHLKKAEEIFKFVLEIDPGFVNAYQNLGIIYLRQKKLEESKKAFGKVLTLDHYSIIARRGLAFIDVKEGRYEEARQMCLQNLEIKNDLGSLEILLGIDFHQKDFLSVKNHLVSFIKEEDDASALTELAALLTMNKIYGLAEDCYTKALRLSPSYKDAYIDQGLLYMKMGLYQKAIDVWQEGLRLYPTEKRFKNYISQSIAADKKNLNANGSSNE